MKKMHYVLLAIILILAGYIIFSYEKKIFTNSSGFNFNRAGFSEAKNILAGQPEELPFRKGEKMIFDFILYKIRCGKSVIQFLGMTKFNGQDVFSIESTTDALNYKGTEKIFCDLLRFHPLRVERNLKIGWRKEEIIEDYDIPGNSVSIKKTKNGRQEKELEIKRDGALQNVITLLYYFRTQKDISVGRKIFVNLPTRNMELEVKGIEDVKVAYGKFKSFFISDKNKSFSIWISADGKNLPLQMQYNYGPQNYSMKLIAIN